MIGPSFAFILASAGDPANLPSPPLPVVLLAVHDRFGQIPPDLAVCRVTPAGCEPVVATPFGRDRAVRLDALPATLRVSAAGFEPDETAFEALADDEEFGTVEVELVARSRLAARFVSPSKRRQEMRMEFRRLGVDPSGPPLASETVVLRSGPDETSVETPVPPGTWNVSWAGDRVAAGLRKITVAGGARTDLGVVRLRGGRTLRGALADARGAPVARASIRVGSADANLRARSVSSGWDGAFEARDRGHEPRPAARLPPRSRKEAGSRSRFAATRRRSPRRASRWRERGRSDRRRCGRW